jgi:hypothetical protein
MDGHCIPRLVRGSLPFFRCYLCDGQNVANLEPDFRGM